MSKVVSRNPWQETLRDVSVLRPRMIAQNLTKTFVFFFFLKLKELLIMSYERISAVWGR